MFPSIAFIATLKLVFVIVAVLCACNAEKMDVILKHS